MPDTRNSKLVSAILVLAGMIAVIASVQGFEHIGGYIPCKLCLAQRQPYYYAMPVALIAVLSAWRGWSPALTRILLAVAGLLLLWTLGLGVYHSGVEWGWWQGPGDCGAVSGGISGDVNDLLGDLTAKRHRRVRRQPKPGAGTAHHRLEHCSRG